MSARDALLRLGMTSPQDTEFVAAVDRFRAEARKAGFEAGRQGAQTQLAALRAWVKSLETERHSTNEALDDAVRETAALRARVAELEAAAKTARTEAIADAGDYLDEAGEKNAAYLLYTTDVPVAREMKAVRQPEAPAVEFPSVPHQRGEVR